MSRLKRHAGTYYRRNLPHYQPPNCTYFTTFRLVGSLPCEALNKLRDERTEAMRKIAGLSSRSTRREKYLEFRWRYYVECDALLDAASTGPNWLAEAPIMSIVSDAMHYWDGNLYDLLGFTIMPNHVHLVFGVGEPRPGSTGAGFVVTDILGSIKKYSARAAHIELRRDGDFWQHESYDHLIRNGEELERILWYMILNSVSAGLVGSWEEWPGTYCKPGLLE